MTRRQPDVIAASHVAEAMDHAHVDASSVAQATDIDATVLESRLQGETSFTLVELVKVGGFLHVPAHKFLEGIAA